MKKSFVINFSVPSITIPISGKDKETYEEAAGKNGFDLQETKLPTYWKTPFSKICLGMQIGQQLRFIFINKTAESLYSLIADGKYHATSLGRDTWKKVVGSQASLQQNCNMEGFNVKEGNSKARIGIRFTFKLRSRYRLEEK